MSGIDADWVAIGLLVLVFVAVVASLFAPDRCPESETRRHDWDYGRRGGGTGWGIVRCTACSKEDIY